MDLLEDKDRGYSLESLYNYLGTTRQRVHQMLIRNCENELKEESLKQEILDWRENHKKMGSRAMYHSLLGQNIAIPMGITKFEQFVSRYGLTAGVSKKKWHRTSDGKGKRNYPNLTNGKELRGINELIVGDITYFFMINDLSYLFQLKDVYSQRIVSIIPSRNMEAINAVRGINEVIGLRGRKNLKKCIHHTDNGSQYESKEYRRILKDLGMLVSRSSNCQENGSAEHLNHVTKNMYLNEWSIRNFKELEEACKEFQFLNNEQRCIKQLGYKTPVSFEKAVMSIPRMERPMKKLHDFTEKTPSR